MLSSHLSGAAAAVTIGGRQYLIAALSDRDFDALSLWHQGRVLRIARASLDADTPESEKRLTLQAAYEYAKGIDFLSEAECGGILAQKEVIAQFVWRLLAKRQAVSLEQARELLDQHAEEIDGLMDVWQLLQFGEQAAPARGPEEANLLRFSTGEDFRRWREERGGKDRAPKGKTEQEART
ncbi:MAG: hypothetical protein ACLQNE_43570 [Thermoguttaceae bacterium]